MIVVADTSPLNYLVLINQIDLLTVLYQKVLIPRSVLRELLDIDAPAKVRIWVSDLPEWCQARDVAAGSSDRTLDRLDEGELDAIHLAIEAGIHTILMDDSEGRAEALRRHLIVTGTLAVLEKAAQRGLIDFRSTLTRLEQTTFRISAGVRAEFLNRNP